MQRRGSASFVPVQAFLLQGDGQQVDLPWISSLDGVPGPDVGETGLEYTMRLGELNTADFLEDHRDMLQYADKQFRDDRMAARQQANAARPNLTPGRPESRPVDVQQRGRPDSPMLIHDPLEAAAEARRDDLYYSDYTGNLDMPRAQHLIDSLSEANLQEFCAGLDPHA